MIALALLSPNDRIGVRVKTVARHRQYIQVVTYHIAPPSLHNFAYIILYTLRVILVSKCIKANTVSKMNAESEALAEVKEAEFCVGAAENCECSVGCCVISCQFFVKSELLLDFTYSGCKGLEKIGWHFFRTQ